MRPIITIILLFATAGLMAQTVEFKDLNAFDKIVIDGNVKSVSTKSGHCDQPYVTVSGLSEEQIKTKIEAGVFHLTMQGEQPVEVVVSNGNLKRIETRGETEIIGAQVMGSNGKYLITNLDNHHHDFSNHVAIDLPHIDLPDIDIDLPDLDFDFDHDFDVDVDWDEDFSWNWKAHKDEMK